MSRGICPAEHDISHMQKLDAGQKRENKPAIKAHKIGIGLRKAGDRIKGRSVYCGIIEPDYQVGNGVISLEEDPGKKFPLIL